MKYNLSPMIRENPDQALETYVDAYIENPLDAAVHYNLGFIYMTQGFYKAAFHHFNEMAKLDPDSEQVLFHAMKVLVSDTTSQLEQRRD